MYCNVIIETGNGKRGLLVLCSYYILNKHLQYIIILLTTVYIHTTVIPPTSLTSVLLPNRRKTRVSQKEYKSVRKKERWKIRKNGRTTDITEKLSECRRIILYNEDELNSIELHMLEKSNL